MSDSKNGGNERGETLNLGPFEFAVPDRECQISSCEDVADGVVTGSDTRINCCVHCAPQFLEAGGYDWTPLAGGRSLDADT